MLRLIILALTLMLTGCLSPYKESAGTYIKTAHSEFRSPFGTNDSFAKLQRCRGPETVVLFYLEGDFTDCKDLPMEEVVQWSHGFSQGQGGQIVEGMMNAGALGAVAASRASTSLTSNATAGALSISSATVTAPAKGGHR